MQDVVFHCGYMKTATTFLQSSVFPSLPDCAFYSFADGFAHLADDLRQKPAPDAVSHQAGVVREWMARSDKELQLFSWEGLIGNSLENYAGFTELTGFLSDIAPQAKILLVIRNQADLCNSLYKQSLHRGHSPKIEEFLNYQAGAFGPFRPADAANMDIRSLDFDHAVQAYENAFGADNVHVLVYEWLRHDRQRFFNGLEECLGRKVSALDQGAALNVGYNSGAAMLARHLNRCYKTPHNPRGVLPYRPFDNYLRTRPGRSIYTRLAGAANAMFDPRFFLQNRLAARLPGTSDLLSRDIRAGIQRECAATNAALDKRRDLGLGALGYY